MMSLRAVLFAVLLPLAACGGHDSSTESSSSKSSKSMTSALPTTPPATKPDVLPEVTKSMAVEDRQPPVAATEEPTPIPGTFADAMKLGKALAAKGDHSRAKEVFEAAAKLDKKSSEPHVELARMYIGMNERALALRSANKAVKLAPTSSQAFNTLGRAELLRYNYENAIEAFRQATELNTDNAWAWNNLGYAHLQLKHYDEAIAALTTATLKKDAAGFMYNNLGTAYEQLDQLDEARTAYEAGGKLGSKEASVSRKRLEGVISIAMYQPKPKTAEPNAVAPAPVEKTYDNAEEMPEDVAPAVEPVVEEPGSDSAPIEQPKPVAPAASTEVTPGDAGVAPTT